MMNEGAKGEPVVPAGAEIFYLHVLIVCGGSFAKIKHPLFDFGRVETGPRTGGYRQEIRCRWPAGWFRFELLATE